MSPRRKPGWIPALTHLKATERGRVRFPNRPAVYFGPVGVWPANQKKPPKAVLDAYKAEVARWLAAGGEDAAPAIQPGKTITIDLLFTAYLVHVANSYRKRGEPTSELRKVDNGCGMVVKLYRDLPAEQFGAAEFRQVRDALLRGDTRGHSTILEYGSRIKAMFDWAADEGLVPESVALVLRGVRWFRRGQQARRTPGRKLPAPIEDVDATLPHLPRSVAAMSQLQLVTAMRAQEVCFMRAGDVTEEPDGLWRYSVRDDANKVSHLGIVRRVFIGPKGQAILAPFLKAARPIGPDTWVFRPERNFKKKLRPWYPNNYSKRISETCQKVGIKTWTPGRLRHTRSTETRRKYGREGAQAELGHVDSSMTGRYSDTVLEELARKIARESG